MTDQIKSMYPTLPTADERMKQLEERLEETKKDHNFKQALQNVRDIVVLLEREIDDYTDKSKKCKYINYAVLVTNSLASLSGIATAVGTGVSGVGLALSAPIASGSIAGGTLVMSLTNYIYIYNKKRKTFSRTLTLANQVLLDFNQLIREAMIDGQIDSNEHQKIVEKYEWYKTNKKEIKTDTKINVADVFSNKTPPHPGWGGGVGGVNFNDEFIAKLANLLKSPSSGGGASVGGGVNGGGQVL